MKMLPKLLIIVGATGVGKTDLAIRLASQMRGEIVSADSRYFYSGMDIGTAKPSAEQLRQIPHHLINVTTPDSPWSLALFQERASQVIREIHSRQKVPLLVGGTGQYIRAVLESWHIPELPPDPALRAILTCWGETIGAVQLHNRLKVIDPAAAERMDASNLRRTVRALEVIYSTGRRFSEQSRRSELLYDVMTIGLRRPRPELYARIDERIDVMIADGLVDEVSQLLRLGYQQGLPAMSAIGYREIGDYLAGKATLDEAVMLIRRNTRKYIRRQSNWFKEIDPEIHWFDMEPDPQAEIIRIVHTWLHE